MDEELLVLPVLASTSGVDDEHKITGDENTASLTRGFGGRDLETTRDRPLSRGTGGNATNCWWSV